MEDGTLHWVPCRDQYTAVVRSTAGVYLQAVPEVRTVDIKISDVHESFLQGQDEHEEEGEDLLYTADEVTAFQDLIHFLANQGTSPRWSHANLLYQGRRMRIYHDPGKQFDVKNLLEDIIPTLGWWDWILEKTDQGGQVCSILALLYWSWSLIRKIVRACTDWRKLEIPLSTATPDQRQPPGPTQDPPVRRS